MQKNRLPSMHKTKDYLSSLQAFLCNQDGIDYEFYHCMFHAEHDLSLKLIANEYFYCYKCSKTGTYSTLLTHCKSYMKRPLSDFKRENFKKEWFIFKDNRTLNRAQERRYNKKDDIEL